MGLTNFILTCEKDNEELKRDINYYKNKASRLEKENQELKKQLEYLKSGEYLNQLKFERDILQNIVDNGEVSKEDKEFIDMTHRNTELLKENQELKKHLEVPETCNLKTLEHYKSYYEDTTKEQILADTYIDYCAYVNLAHRYSELEKQLEETDRKLFFAKNELDMREKTIDNKLNQQKEFIKWLENGIEKVNNTEFLDERIQRAGLIAYNRCLQKYKEIIGTTNEQD